MIDSDNIFYSLTDVDTILPQIKKLTKAHWDEAGVKLENEELMLDTNMLHSIEALGTLRIIQAVDTSIDKIVGYVVFNITQSMFGISLIASSIAFYVSPEYRNLGIAKEMLMFADIHFTQEGVDFIQVGLKNKLGSLHGSITDIGYELDELVYLKRI